MAVSEGKMKQTSAAEVGGGGGGVGRQRRSWFLTHTLFRFGM